MVFPGEKLMSHRFFLLTAFLLFYLVARSSNKVSATPEDDAIAKWAEKFGDELWELGKRMTKSPEIKAKYKEYNARVERKNGSALLRSIVNKLGRMLSRKMDAVKCISKVAETAAEQFIYNDTYAQNEFQYYSSKFSQFNGKRAEELLLSVKENARMYLNMSLNPDTHFYNIPVDTSHSSVHVPSNIYDKNPNVLKALMWSEALDDVFVQNYQSDPALSWQYFGSDTGILRHYPALQWDDHDPSENADTYDCRKRSWYIETATCSKDIVILLDNSGSMTGFRNHIAKFTIRSIMNTFSNNDFFTIFNYSATVNETIPCFEGALVQATPENIEAFNYAISKMQPEGYANLTIAYERAFQLLKKYYIERRCNETSTCNQAIMVVTDSVAGNTTEIFEKYNWGTGDNGTSRMRVRIFTYLLGKEVTKVREIQWMACLNRGYYSHVQTLDEVHEEVLKYVDVIATPLVLQDVEHPPTWTHAFTDKTYKLKGDASDARLMIAIGVPAFDRSYLNKNSTRRARLLGVASTDVPVEDIDKLTLPYKLGVNGYSFVVSNNGYVLLHPDLRPSQNGILNENYNSIDMTEVEHLFEDNEPRQPGDTILDLRRSMVRHETGKFTNVTVKFHYDKMRRVSKEDQDYFYEPLPNTPFSLGLVLPSHYGKTWIKVGEEVKKNIHMNINISDYFVGENWKIHPQWVYCKYHYLEGHEFKTPEDELREFLVKMSKRDWKWSEQYENDGMDDFSTESEELNCGRITFDDDAYYCNKELVQLLIFDAKVTNSSYGQWKFTDADEQALIERYNATLRFVATMSGLTRWQFIYGEVEVDSDREFGDFHTTAIDETWYKSAILQHKIDPEGFVYSVPHVTDPAEESELKVTASYAIFPRDGGLEAPGCVVGFQFSHKLMLERFANITSEENCNGCVKTCNTDENECYVVDNNAYVVLSDNLNDTGRFFGEVEGAVMDAMVEKDIFKSLNVFDYQALCREEIKLASDGHSLLDPIRLLTLTFKWLIAQFFWHWSHLQMWAEGMPFYDDDDEDYEEPMQTVGQRKTAKLLEGDEQEKVFPKPPPEPVYEHCDTRSTLYILDEKSLINFHTAIQTNYSRPFHVKRIPKSNLILVIVKVMYSTEPRKSSTRPVRVTYDTEFPCYKLEMSFLERRRLEECYTEHPDEEEYTYCGDATTICIDAFSSAITLAMIFLAKYLYG